MSAALEARSPPAHEWIAAGHASYGAVTAAVTDPILKQRAGRAWWIAFGVSLAAVMVMLVAIGVLFTRGTGTWGVNTTVGRRAAPRWTGPGVRLLRPRGHRARLRARGRLRHGVQRGLPGRPRGLTEEFNSARLDTGGCGDRMIPRGGAPSRRESDGSA